jgi:hypothetical protein
MYGAIAEAGIQLKTVINQPVYSPNTSSVLKYLTDKYQQQW